MAGERRRVAIAFTALIVTSVTSLVAPLIISHTIDAYMDKVKAAVKLVTDETHGLRQVIIACRKGGRVSIPGVYGGVTDKFPIGALMEKGLSIKSGQTHVQKYMPDLLKRDLLLRHGGVLTQWGSRDKERSKG